MASRNVRIGKLAPWGVRHIRIAGCPNQSIDVSLCTLDSTFRIAIYAFHLLADTD
jgi:hypothetical protein